MTAAIFYTRGRRRMKIWFSLYALPVVRAVDKYAKLLRASVANPGNEHRLVQNEAPPAIVSIFLGEQLSDIFDQLAVGGAKSSKQGGELKLGVSGCLRFRRTARTETGRRHSRLRAINSSSGWSAHLNRRRGRVLY